jgi:polyisoprenyl-phosphate glycosyltransferase
MKELTIVVPCFNEEEALRETCNKLLELLNILIEKNKITPTSKIVFVDDGSTDNTWNIIEELSHRSRKVHGIKLSNNRGHQNALLAGLLNVSGDIIVSIDADLQDDLMAIEKMIDLHYAGNDIVYGVRGNRSSDSFLKRYTAELFYKILKLMKVNIVFNHADFRLMSRRTINELKKYNETNLFLRGLIPSIGFRSAIVLYDRRERMHGESKYPYGKMLSLAIHGITSYSSFPLRLIAGLGLIIFLFTLSLSLWVFWVKIFKGDAIPGWASSVLPMYLLGGIQLLSIGIVGEYVGKIYMETKKRPRFIIEKMI